MTNIAAPQLDKANAFHANVLGMRSVMNLGWILTFASDFSTAPQISIASEGGSGTAVPDLSIEVDNFDEIHDRAVAGGFVVEYGPTTEPWGVRRFYVGDPFGRLVNILSHA